MTTLNSYLTFNGNCIEVFNFYKSVFGGDFTYVGKFKDMPKDANIKINENDKEKIMHISLPISENVVLMGCDTSEELVKNFIQGNNFSISINLDNKEEAKRLFNGLSKNGKITMPLNKTFWGSYFGMLTDQFGIQWMVNLNDTDLD